MLICGNPDQMGSIESRCQHGGKGTHWVSMTCKSSLCLRCAKVSGDDWVSQVSTMLHAGGIYHHMVLTVPDVFRNTFYQHAQPLLGDLMRCRVRCLDDFFSRVSRRPLQGG
jgi:hypothetical protein